MEINGREIAQEILINLTKRVSRLKETFDITPHLAVIRVGDDPAITSYINQKKKMALAIGAELSVYQHPNEITTEKLLEEIHFLQSTDDLHGLLVQLPLPAHLDAEKLIHTIQPDKDVDGFHPQTHFVVPIAAAIIAILEKIYALEQSETHLTFTSWLQSQHIVVIGKGKTGGEPVITLLKELDCNPTVIDSKTTNKENYTKKATVIISAVGKREIIQPDMISEGVILIGIGLNRDEQGIFGDYNEEDIKDIATYYTPSPGGVGPVNVAKLMENLVIAAEKKVRN